MKLGSDVKIACDFIEVKSPKGYLVLVHMMPATKESWRSFAAGARKAGYASIAIDLRGHGESDGGPNGYRNFSNAEHQKSILDLQAAVDYLQGKGAKPEQIYFVGASIGANLSLGYLAERPDFKKAVLLSAGLNYRGIAAKPLLGKLKPDQKIFAVASRDDNDNVEENEKLFGTGANNLIIYDRGGHGTDILENNPESIKTILNFLNG